MLVIWLVIILSIIAVAQLMRISTLAKNLRNKREEDVSDSDNTINAILIGVSGAVFLGSTLYMLLKYGNGLLPEAASEHGREIDFLFNLNWIIVFFVFLAVNGILIIFSVKYRGKKGNKAYYFPHDNRLEIIWTVVPACALAVIIILGLRTWNDITGKPSADAKVVEVFGEQFSWTVRYSGDDNKLGYADYKLISGENPLGVITPSSIKATIVEMDGIIEDLGNRLYNDSVGVDIYSKADLKSMQSKMEKYIRLKERVLKMQEYYTVEKLAVANDDYTTKMELHLIKDQEYQFIFRSKDVMHSAYFPHFRAQMNVVPGMRTKFKMKPIISTAEMREITGNENFNYILLCNKICGESHYNMKMIVVVDENIEEFNAWKAENTKEPIAQN